MENTELRTSPATGEPTAEQLVAAQREHDVPAAGQTPNINPQEALVSLAGGAAAVLAGLWRGKASGLLLTGAGAALLYRGYTKHCHLYGLLGVNTADRSDGTAVPATQGYRIERSVTINCTAEELYTYWRKLENLPDIMPHLKSVEELSETRSHWIAEGPFDAKVEWDAEIITDRENEIIAWRSVEEGNIDTAGSVRFTPLSHDRGTVLRVNLKYNPPGGKLGATLAKVLGRGFEQQMAAGIARFKSHMEAGEIPTTEGQPRGSH